MILLVNDASILIDLLKADLIKPFFKLDCEFHVTDFTAEEVQEENADQLEAFVQGGKLLKKTFDFEALREIQRLETAYKALSIADCSCLYLAQQLAATLLTGDAALRRIAEQNQIPVHGLLWVFDELVKQGLISLLTARQQLQHLMSINFRLPAEECNKRIFKWKKDAVK